MGMFKKHSAVFIFICFALAAGGIGYVTFGFAVQREQNSLIDRTETVAAALDEHDIFELSGDASDEGKPAYWELKQKMIRVAQANTDVTSVYLVGYRDGNIFFYADSVASGEVDEAIPGLVYDEATPLFISVFTEGKTIFEGPISDRWGSWVSAIVPILNPNDGSVMAAIGLDINSRIYKENVAMATAVPVLLFSIVFLFIFAISIRYRKNREVVMLRAKFVSIASHELRSPVSGIVWAAQSLLGQKRKTSVAVREVLQQIEKSGRQILGTISEILDFSKLQSIQSDKVLMNGVDLAGLVHEVIDTLALVMQQMGVRVRVDVSLPDRLLVLCDKEKTRRVISNILTNALKYSNRGGEVVIGYEHKDGHHVLSVKDNGVGIPASEQANIFRANFRASNAEHSLIEGTGIGLHMVKELMESQGGEVRFISTLGEGTTFFVHLKDR